MDTLIHWQWVAWLGLCASVPAPTSEQLVCWSRWPARFLRITWRWSSNTGNDLKNNNNNNNSRMVEYKIFLHFSCNSTTYGNILPKHEIGNQRRSHISSRRRWRCAIVSDLMTKSPIGYHRWRWIAAGVDIHQWHPRHLCINYRIWYLYTYFYSGLIINILKLHAAVWNNAYFYLIRIWSIWWCWYSVHDRWWLNRRLIRWIVRRDHVNRWLIRVIPWCWCHCGHRVVRDWISTHVIS